MLYQPTNIYPSMTGTLGNGVIDANKDLTVSWQVNGNSPMTAFQIEIFKNNFESTQLLSTGRLTDNCPHSGINYKGEVQAFSYEISATALKNAGIANGGEYKLTIKQWWTDEEYVSQTSASAFITRSTPLLSINEYPNPLTTRKHTFTAESDQYEGDAPNWVRWQLASVSYDIYEDSDEIIDDTGRIYGTTEFQYTFDGFISENLYAIKCSAQTENGVEFDTGWQYVDVEYEMQPINGTLQACGSRLGSGVKLTLPEVKNIPGKVRNMVSGLDGTYSISDSYIRIDTENFVNWGNEDGRRLDIRPDSESGNLSLAWRGKAASNGVLLYGLDRTINGGADGFFELKTSTDDISMRGIANLPFSPSISSCLCVGNGIYLAGDTSGVFYTEDGTTWTRASMPTKNDGDAWKICHGVTIDGDTYFASSGTTHARSFDGKTWEELQLAFKPVVISFANNKFFAACEDGLYYSWNAAYWDKATISFAVNPYGTVAYGNGVYTTIANDFCAYSYDGKTWSGIIAQPYSFADVCFGGGVFVAAECNNPNGTKITYSYDGVNWNLTTLPTPREMVGISHIGGMFILAYVGGLATSYDGTTWVEASNTSGSWMAIASSESQIIVAAADGSVKISNQIEKKLYVSAPGISTQFTQIADSGELSVFSDGMAVYVSSDLGNYTWDLVTTGIDYTESISVPAVLFGNGRYVVPIMGSNNSLYSDDGVMWKESEKYSSAVSTAMAHATAAIYADGTFYVFAYDESAQSQKGAILSGDGVNWNIQYVENANDVNVCTITYSEQGFVALTKQGKIYSLNRTSSNPAWEFKSNCPITSGQFMAILYVNGVYAAISDADSDCAYTNDLVNWSTAKISTNNVKIQDSKVLNGLFVVVGYDSTAESIFVSTSNNGTIWTTHLIQDSRTTSMYARIAFANGEFAVCNDSNMWHSEKMYEWKSATLAPGGTRYLTGGYTGFLACRPDGFRMGFTSGVKQITKLDIQLQLKSIYDLSMFGYLESDYAVVGDSNALSGVKNRILLDMSYHPNDVATKFFADFISGTNGGGVGDTGFTDFAIYRQTPGDSAMTHVFDISPEDGNVIIDTSAVTNTPYVYYAYGIGSVSAQAIQSNLVTMCLWDWAVISCTQDVDGTCRPERIFLFGKNLSSGAIGNNNTPNILQNFTQYPTLQPVPWNYRSGTLSSLIGVISDGVYSDTVEMQEQIYALSTTTNELFLKDRKGNFIKIRISGQIEMSTMDGTPQQAQNVKIPWIEIGSTNGIKIKLTKNDGAWPY